jgi:uncharacterized protein YdeI (YjbR/CyaY-like superfamily)
MAPVIVDPHDIRSFKDWKALDAWYRKNHDRAEELWLRVYKKGSGVPSVTIAEALDCALCWGWIDAIRKSFDDKSYLQRYTRRSRTSSWSQINREHVKRLIAEGRMTEHGLREVERAKADGRWDRAYAGPAKAQIPADLMAAIEADPKALATFETLSSQNRFALVFRLNNLKTDAARQRNIEKFVAMLGRGETFYPQSGKPKPK